MAIVVDAILDVIVLCLTFLKATFMYNTNFLVVRYYRKNTI